MPGEEDETYEEVAVELEDSDDDFQYEEVDVLSDGDDDDDAVSEDLDAALKRLKETTAKTEGLEDEAGSTSPGASRPGTSSKKAGVSRRPEVVDDFIRNFFVKMGLKRTLEVFENEWYELKALGKLSGDTGNVPDLYMHNAGLEDELHELRAELQEAKQIATRATATWDKFRKERDFHRMHHKRVAQEKNKLILDIKRLKTHYEMYEPTIKELKKKYEAAMKEKTLVRIDRDKLAAANDALGAQVRQLEEEQNAAASSRREQSVDGGTPPSGLPPPGRGRGTADRSTTDRGTAEPKGKGPAKKSATSMMGTNRRPPPVVQDGVQLPAKPRPNPLEDLEFDPVQIKSFSLQKTFKGHLMSISNLVLHPTKPIVVTASDDKTWRMWHLPEGDLIMSGEGHKDWVAGVDFHPRGICLASTSGDSTVKIWDFEQQRCVTTFTDHNQAVWGCAFHDMGEYLASCSLDHSARLYDLTVERCKMALRGHVDSVNSIVWQPYTSNCCTASSDKTVSIWDGRTGLCVQTFYGHGNSCNHAAFNLRGTVVGSTDADGCLKLWDVRMVAELLTVPVSEHAANKCAFDRSGEVIAVASDDGRIHSFGVSDGEFIMEFTGHEDAVQSVAFDPHAEFMVSAGSDNSFRLWA